MTFKRSVLSATVALFLLTACGQPGAVEQTGPAPTATSAPSNAPVTAPKSTDVPAATTVPETQAPAEPADAATAIPEEEVAPQAAESDSANAGEGVASYLSDSLHGQVTASGETYNKDEYVAAHKDLPFGTEVLVTNLYNGNSVTVTIIDRLPSNNPHLIDVSGVAAVELDMLDAGNVDARIEWSE